MFRLYFIAVLCVFTNMCWAVAFKPILNVLAPMGVLSPKIVSQFEEETHTNVRVEFIGSRYEYDSRLRAGLRNYDVIIADERNLQRLSLQRLLRSLTDDSISIVNPKFPLDQRSKLNLDGRSYVTLLIDPMGIAYKRKSFSLKQNQINWDLLINPDENPYWRQRVFVSNSPKHQLLIALLATGKEITSTSWFIPEASLKWLQNLKLQSTNIDYPLELAFLGNKIEAAVVFRSEYLKLKKVVPDLKFMIPANVTYYDRMGASLVADTVQESLAQSFVKFLKIKRDSLISNENFLSYKVQSFEGSSTKNWILYDDDFPLPRRIENILNDFYKK
ncbi:substrate-binding domain-containing protein [Fluviispira multicolorata]|uniref:substrate-binding domain-containing protein n=1 Tax=Fluviispira multicolorata TaxID=2654512 RepID=UPI001375F3EA|nr:substrate-binding domain-containing protein [Fluviispira multicolorata]